MTAPAVDRVRHANGVHARSAAKPRNGAKLTPAGNRRKVAWTGECPMEGRLQFLRSVTRFQLMRPPATLSWVATQDWVARESCAAFLFPPQMRHAVCPPTGIWTASQPL